VALDRLHVAHPGPAEAKAWQEARTALVQALGRVRTEVGAAPPPSSEEAQLAALDRFADEEDDDDEETQ
jgi:hypothetical protein